MNRLRRVRVLDTLAALAFLLLVGFGAHAWRHRADPSVALRYNDDLRELLTLGTRKTGEVMKARSGIVGHYDGLVQTSAAIDRVLVRLEDAPGYLPDGARRELRELLSAVAAAHTDAAYLVDHFKRESSVLRNSLRYLPVLAREIDDRLSHDADAQTISLALNTLVRNELLLQGWQERLLADRVAEGIRGLEAALEQSPPEHRATVRLALAHARKVQRLTPRVNDLTRRIIALPTVERTRALMQAFDRHYRVADARTARDAVVTFGLALTALLLVAASVITRMRRSAAALRETQRSLEQAVESLQELAELKSRFVSMTSHEFRTPLSVIMSSSEMLEAYSDRWTAEKKADHFGRIRGAAMGMTRMLEDILLIGRSDAGALQFEPHTVDLTAFCKDVLENVANATGDADRIEYAGLNGDAQATVDDALLRHVLENLLSNALKYSGKSSPVRFEVKRDEGAVVFTVSDRGIGISAEDQARLFETFHRGTNVGQVSGTGLGLAIVKRAVDLHHGRLHLQSEVGVGSTFSVSIPTAMEGA